MKKLHTVFGNPAAGFLLATLLCFGIRFGVCLIETARLKTHVGADFSPFLAESAVAWAQANCRADGRDPDMVTTGGSGAAARLSGGIEHFAALSIRARRLFAPDAPTAWEDNPAEAEWVKFTLALWIALGGGILWLWLKWDGLEAGWCFAGVLFFSVMPSALARYTGQDLLKGAFAMNFLLLAMAFDARSRAQGGGRISTALFWCSVFLAGICWDMAQILLGAWALWNILSGLAANRPNPERLRMMLALWTALAAAAVATPYGRLHGSIASPVTLVLAPLAVAAFLPLKRRTVAAAGAVLVLLWCGIMAAGGGFAGSYSHFGELLLAKVRWLNSKPADPGLLTFYQRILWTPELQSADLRTTAAFFPLALPAALLSWLLLRRREENAKFRGYALLTLLFFAIFILMVRFHEMAAVFLAPWCAFAAALGFRKLSGSRWKFLWLLLWLGAVPLAEAGISLRPRRYSAGLPMLADAVAAARSSEIAGQTVLADFELGCLLAGYAGARIAVQPKFELEETRETTRRYIEILYKGTLEELAELCEEQQVRFVFLRNGQGSEPLHPYSYRYMADAATVPRRAPVMVLGRTMDVCAPGFRRAHFSAEHRQAAQAVSVFRFVSENDRESAMNLLIRAAEAFRDGDDRMAAAWAWAAYRLDPISELTGRVLENVACWQPGPLMF